MRSLTAASPHPGAAFSARRRPLLHPAAAGRESILPQCWRCEKTQDSSYGSSLRISRLPRTVHRDISKNLLAPTAGAVSIEQAEAIADLPKGDMWSVHKFGGTCMGTSERIHNVADIVLRDPSERKLVVVSAMSKVTDMMYNLVNKAQSRDDSYIAALDEVFDKHMATAKDLLAGEDLARFLSQLHADISNLKAMLQAIYIAGHATESFSDFVVGHGELWSAQMLSYAIQKSGTPCSWMDTREVLVVNPSGANQVDPDYLESEKRLEKWFSRSPAETIIATGFIASTPENIPTTLKRDGSDFSAAIIGSLVKARQVTIWTDVDGVFSADPRKVSEAVILSTLSYQEAWEMSYFGANVLHPRTIIPVMKYNIPIVIRNIFNTSAPGTMICQQPANENGDLEACVKAFATIDKLALVNVEGTGMAGVPGTANAIFGAVKDVGANVIMISQASSEHSVCFAVPEKEVASVSAALHVRFCEALAAGRLSKVEVIHNCSILAAVGLRMASTPGVSATLFDALAKANINVRAIAQGCSEYNITVVLKQEDCVRALRAAHSRFFLSKTTLAVGIIGPGLIGRTLLNQLKDQAAVLKENLNIDLRVMGITGSRTMLLSDIGIDLTQWKEKLQTEAELANLDKFVHHLSENHFFPNRVLVDCTADTNVASHYYDWLKKGIHVITPNKKANSGPLDRYLKLRTLQRASYTHYFYEATVGAGLPIISTLRGLLETGDKILRIEGIFSGTLSYIFNNFEGARTFSDVVAEAKEAGYTEPDPRDDLSGTDVARKVIILARESGLSLELSDIPVRSLVPEALRGRRRGKESRCCSPGSSAITARDEFVEWLNNLQIDAADNWMLAGDFNFYRSISDRNRDGGNMNDIMIFNEIISNLGLLEIPLKGRNFTWSNMQSQPLLEQIDWVFTSINWISDFPNTLLLPLARPTSDHIPCKIQIGTSIPKAQVFRFENFWVKHPGFFDVVKSVWSSNVNATNSATRFVAKLKLLRAALKKWSKGLSNLNILIQNCNEVLATLDALEEQRPLFTQEFNFRKILKDRILRLLKYKNEYWKKRYTVRWTKFGDENTSFFHAAATERYRLNTITTIEADDGRIVSDHNGKASLLLEEYKKRMGCTSNPVMLYNLSQLVVTREDLEHLSRPFSTHDIDTAVKCMPANKAPGPDGFNGFFLKSCWEILKEDFYTLCFDFFNGSLDLQAINSSFITLIPKTNNPTSVNDFRPISLLNCVLKIITKLMANRLQSKIISLIHTNQYGFIRTRTIQDCLAWAYEYIYQCQHSKRELVILKLDFTKAFDTVEHNVILQMLKHLGFDEKWCDWTQRILASGTSSILLNGVPGKHFHCKRGVRQGDPLSPLLFVLAADLLQCIINRGHRDGLFELPIPSYEMANYPIIQYADDTILIMKAAQRELFTLKGLLESFSQSTGLRVNYKKSCLVPLNLSAEKAQQLARVFGCKLDSLPFTYLGLPMGTTKPRVEHFGFIMNNVERRLTATSNLLSHAGRLQLVNSVISSLPTYAMCTLQLPVSVLDYIDRARRHCLWRSSDSNAKMKPLVAWKKCSKPKRKGGLGIINLRSQNIALLLKHLDKFYNKKEIPWVKLVWFAHYSDGEIPHATTDKGSFWWRDILKLCDLFRGIANCRIGDGSTVLFWSDLWNDNVMQVKFPRLYSFARHKKISVSQFLLNNSLESQFHLPLSEQAYQEFQSLQEYIQTIQVQQDSKDSWRYIWGSNIYTSSSFYNFPYKNIQPPAPFVWIWDSKCCNKLRVFSWLLFMDRLNTRNILKRKKHKLEGNNYNCVLCTNNVEETAFHLFFSCPFSKECWQYLGIQWNYANEFFQMLLQAKQHFQSPFFMEIFTIAAWQIWKQRNDFIFDRGRPSFSSWKRLFIEEAKLQAWRFCDAKRPAFSLCIDSLA